MPHVGGAGPPTALRTGRPSWRVAAGGPWGNPERGPDGAVLAGVSRVRPIRDSVQRAQSWL